MSDGINEALSAHQVAAWLRRHPRFLQQYPDIAVSLELPKESGKTASLASYQLDVLREKNRELNRRLSELFANAQDNERLTVRTHQLTLDGADDSELSASRNVGLPASFGPPASPPARMPASTSSDDVDVSMDDDGDVPVDVAEPFDASVTVPVMITVV